MFHAALRAVQDVECRILSSRVEPNLTEDVGYPIRVVLQVAPCDVGRGAWEKRSRHQSFFFSCVSKIRVEFGSGERFFFGLSRQSARGLGGRCGLKQMSGGIRRLCTAADVGCKRTRSIFWQLSKMSNASPARNNAHTASVHTSNQMVSVNRASKVSSSCASPSSHFCSGEVPFKGTGIERCR